MSDHLHIDLNVTIFDKCQMQFDERGNELKDILQKAVSSALEEYGFKRYREEYFISTSVY